MNQKTARSVQLLISCAALMCLTSTTLADTPLGWISAGNTSAYTTTKGELEISLGSLAVNDTLDVFNYREDLINASGRLVGDSGDLSGHRMELNYGISEDISIFYRRQEHELTIDLGEINSVELVDIDDSLNTLAESAGLKWTFYRANLLNPNNRQSSGSLELSAFRSKSDDFDVVMEEIRLDNLTIFFGVPQTFSVANLDDDGWKARFIYTIPFQQTSSVSVWAGYGESQSTSATTSDLQSATLRSFFEQNFDLEESYYYLGASFVAQFSPRFALNVNYEFINVARSDFQRLPKTPLPNLPGFLSAAAQASIDTNHALNARLAYWLTPKLNVSLTGNLFANQFVGIMPHYNNPLSGSFSSTPYGYAGIELIYNVGDFR